MNPHHVTLTALLMLLAWSLAMSAIGHAAAIALLVPLLMITGAQANRPLLPHRPAPRRGSEEDGAP